MFMKEQGTDKIPDDDMFVKVSFRLKIGDLIDSNIMQLLPTEFAKSLVEELLNPSLIKQNEVQMQYNRHQNQLRDCINIQMIMEQPYASQPMA